jgi:electron-transferring-flavoprotein dehydrogenase
MAAGPAYGGGSFVYHGADQLVTVGFVVHLDYANPTLSPFDEFQRFKTHPSMRDLLAGGRRVAYGARALTEGGWQAVPRVAFPGGALIGCAAGFMNVARIKGSHNAILSGMQAADAIVAEPDLAEPRSYEAGWRMSAIGRDLCLSATSSRSGRASGWRGWRWAGWTCGRMRWRGSVLGTLRHRKADHASLRPRAEVTPIVYPNPDGVLTFDRLSSVYLSGVNHEENQPCHLRLADPLLPIRENLPRFGEPARLYCPAGVYEVAVAADGAASFVINAQNCVHCKTCDIKDPAQNITWTPPEGGGGPNYANM